VAGGRVTGVLVVNPGSSSVKLSLLGDGEEPLACAELDAPRGTLDAKLLARALDGPLRDADAVGVRVVHGGERFRDAVLLDDRAVAALRELTELAPLHQPRSLAAIDAVRSALPALPAVACFDTAFHATLDPAAATYALPAAWRERWGIRRYGFHGLSHAWVSRRAGAVAGMHGASPRIVSCHLGAGASLCAIADGRSRDTTMGFTPLEGLVMATRSGSVDPGVVLWLLHDGRLELDALEEGLERGSGLAGLAGTADMREVLAREDPAARLAISVYLHRLRGAVASMAATLGGLDVLAFTGGIGEHAATVREQAAAGLRFLGVELDAARNARANGDADVSADGASVRTVVVRAREDLEIAAQTRAVLSPRG
jgi:acetate kinase